MFKKLLLLSALLTGALFAQSEPVSGTILNVDGTVLAGGVITAQLTNSSGVSYDKLPYNSQTVNIPIQQVSAILDSSGSFSFVVTSNAQVSGSNWTFTVCSPSASAQCASVTQAITTTTSLSSVLNAAIAAAVNPSSNATVAFAQSQSGSVTPSNTVTFSNKGFQNSFLVSQSTSAAQFVVAGRDVGLAYPVPYLTPTTNNTNIAFDLFPKGVATDFSNRGVVWEDICSTDVNADAVNYECLTLGKFAQLAGFPGNISMSAGGTGVVRPLLMQNNGGNLGINMSSIQPGAVLELHTLKTSGLGTAAAWNTVGIRIDDTTAVAAGVGGGVVFAGNYTGVTEGFFSGIDGTKLNATAGDHSGILNFYTTTLSTDTFPTKKWAILNDGVLMDTSIKTVATLTACTAANKAGWDTVSDATTPTYNGALTGGGAVVVPVFCNGTAWTSH